jgi:hypothetical protein
MVQVQKSQKRSHLPAEAGLLKTPATKELANTRIKITATTVRFI